MAGIAIRVDVSDLAIAGQALDALREAAGNLEPMMDEIGAMLAASVQRRFETETGPDGAKWAKSHRARSQGGRTLTDAGHLLGSITHNAAPGEVEVGSNLIYAGVHQDGATIRAKSGGYLRFRLGGRRGANRADWARKREVTIPARPFLGLDAGDKAAISDIVGDYLAAAIERTA